MTDFYNATVGSGSLKIGSIAFTSEGENLHIPIIGDETYRISATTSNMNDTSYTAGMVLGNNVLTFPNAVRAEGYGGTIISASANLNDTVLGNFTLKVFEGNPTFETFANAANINTLVFGAGKQDLYVGDIDFGYQTAFSAYSTYSANSIYLGYRISSGTSLYGLLVCTASTDITNASAAIKVTLSIKPD